MCNSLVKYFSIFYNIRNVVTSHVVRAIYFACIHSRIKYGIETYGSASEYNISKLQTLQNKLLKLLTKKERYYSTNKLHKNLNILKVKPIYETPVLIRDTPIALFKNYFDLRGHAHNYNLRNNEDLASNQIRTNTEAHSTHTVGAKLWNNTPKVITDITMQELFG